MSGATRRAKADSAAEGQGPAWRKKCRFVLPIIGTWIGYVVLIELLAGLIVNDQRDSLGRGVWAERLRREAEASDPDTGIAPPLARWDSFWYYYIARYGYAGDFEESEFSGGFLPLYPWTIRVVHRLTAADLFTAGLWISRLSLLVVLLLLATYGRRIDVRASPHAAAAAYLAFPSAFILVSVYTEALFVALCLGAFVAADRRRHLLGGILAALAVLTRINGIALVPCLAILGWQQRHRAARPWWRYTPAAGAVVGMVLVGAIFGSIFDDPFAFSTAKRENWGSQLTWPWETLWVAIENADAALVAGDLGSVYTLLELPCLYLVVSSFVVLAGHRLWPEAVFVAGSAGLSLVSGTLWGLPRFCLVLFPMFFVVAMLRQTRWAWHLYLIGSSMLQAYVLFVYVSFRLPAP